MTQCDKRQVSAVSDSLCVYIGQAHSSGSGMSSDFDHLRRNLCVMWLIELNLLYN